MSSTTTQPIWTQPDWMERAAAWIHAELARLGIVVTGDIEQPHVRVWSTVLRVPTADGAVYFKACTPLLAYEPALVDTLHRTYPDQFLRVLATNLEQGWILMVDGGTRLREVIRADRDLSHWERLLPRYAELQIELAGRTQELLALGVPDRQPAVLSRLAQQLLENQETLLVGQHDGLPPATYRRLCEMTPVIADQCRQLAACGVPSSLNHGDLHDANIFIDGDDYLLFDWGDSSVSHPFFSLRTVFVSVENSLHLAEGAPEFDRLRDAYLEPWTLFLPAAELRSTFALASRLSPLCSALSWHHGISAVDRSLVAEYASAIPSLFQEYFDLQDSAAG
ncbi:MAG: phosphotransferase [Anaerolineae bacterium]|nr:phosphotransferase [Anaerolineae bacterium]